MANVYIFMPDYLYSRFFSSYLVAIAMNRWPPIFIERNLIFDQRRICNFLHGQHLSRGWHQCLCNNFDTSQVMLGFTIKSYKQLQNFSNNA